MSLEYFTAQLLHYVFHLCSLYSSWALHSSSGMLKCSHAFLGHFFLESHKVIFLLTRGYKHQCANSIWGQVSKFDQSEQTIFKTYRMKFEVTQSSVSLYSQPILCRETSASKNWGLPTHSRRTSTKLLESLRLLFWAGVSGATVTFASLRQFYCKKDNDCSSPCCRLAQNVWL